MIHRTEQSNPDPQLPSSGRMILVMGLIGLTASVLLVATFVITEPFIEANLAAYLEQAIGEVLPEAQSRTTFFIDGDEINEDDGTGQGGMRVFAGYDADSVLAGIVIEAQGQGYADIIRLIYAYSFDCACIVGLKVLESRETPGLGDKIEKDPAFLANFRELDVRWSEDEQTLTGQLELIKRGERTSAWQIHGISGATISSRAITDILNVANSMVLPILHANKGLFIAGSNE